MRVWLDSHFLFLPFILLFSSLTSAGPLVPPEAFLLREGSEPSISGDGIWVAYKCNGYKALCLSDTVNRTTEILVTVAGGGILQYVDISRNGRVIAYWVRPFSQGSEQLFVYDRDTQSTELVSVNSDEVPGTFGVPTIGSLYHEPHISGDGRYVVFASGAINLVANDTNGFRDVFLRDRLLGVTTRVSLSSTGAQGDGDSGNDRPVISADGNRIIFYSQAENLTPGDISDDLDPYDYQYEDAFLVDIAEGTIVRLSEKPGTSIGGDDDSYKPAAISPNGKFASIQTSAANLYVGVHSRYDVVLYNLTDKTPTHVNKPAFGAPQIDTTLDLCNPDFNFSGDILYFCAGADNLVAGDSEYSDDIFAWRDGVLTRIHPAIDGVAADAEYQYPSTNDLGDVLAFETSFKIGIIRRGDVNPPEVLELGLIPGGPVLQGAILEIEALASDVNRGETNIQSAEFTLDGGPWLPMSAFDGGFDSSFERVQGFSDTSSLLLGTHTVCVSAQDLAGLISAESCLDFELVDTVTDDDFMVQCYHTPLWPQPGETVQIFMRVLKSDGSGNSREVQRKELWFNNLAGPVSIDNVYGAGNFSYTSNVLTAGSFSYGCRAKQNEAAVFSGWKTVAVGSPGADKAIPVVFTGESSKRIDVVFIADADSYEGPDDPVFLTDIYKLIRDGYYQLPVFNQHQHLMNFWLAGSMGTADRIDDVCTLTAPADWDENYAFADVGAIIHTDNLRDCAKSGLFSTEPTSTRVSLHETGHAPFGLADEYCCDGGYFQTNFLPNVYTSIEACEADAPDLGREAADCRSWVSTRNDLTYFTSEPTENDLMIDNKTPNAADLRRFLWLFEKTATQSD